MDSNQEPPQIVNLFQVIDTYSSSFPSNTLPLSPSPGPSRNMLALRIKRLGSPITYLHIQSTTVFEHILTSSLPHSSAGRSLSTEQH